MREIKFRAWDKKNKVMCVVWGLNWTFDGKTLNSIVAVSPVINGEYILQAGQFELMQSTGLKDKNGKEIWEGDIVRDKYEKYIVLYQEGYFALLSDYWRGLGEEKAQGTDYEEYLLSEYKASTVEVIGNIYENPELLTNLTS